MSSKVRVAASEYRGFTVQGSRELTSELQGGASLADVQALVLHSTIKPWTLDQLLLTFDTDPIGDGGDPSIQIVKVPADVKVDTYLASGSSDVVTIIPETTIGDLTGPLAINDLFAIAEASNANNVKTENDRRFERGDRLVALLRNFSRTGAQGAGTGSGSGADLDIGFENASLAWLGRTTRI